MEQLEKLRKKIDKIDSKLLSVFKQRFVVTDQIGVFKRANNLKVEDKSREKAHLQFLQEQAEELGLDLELVKKIYKLIVKEVKERSRD